MQQVAQLQRAPVRLAQLQTARSRQQEAEDRVLAHRTERTRIRRRQRELAQRQADRVQKFAQVDGIEQACAAATEVVTLRRGERDGLIERRGALRTRSEHLAALATQTMQNRQERKLLQAKAWLHEQLVEAFGKDGIQALIIEHAIPEIEEEANAILRRLTDNRIQIAIESIRDLKSGGSRETLDIKISDEIGERGYDMYSGGEAFRSDFALRLALSKVLARRAGTQLRTLIIDEGFGTQDSHGLEQLKDSINIVCADFDKVIIVTHLDELKSAFPTQIEVTKPPGRGSEFEIRHLA
jgi:exonuclease SbcC